ncbi:enhancer of yellow 2 transcription factor-like [Tropilaelaps mercedesae]|uniref:Transcription and mRNA export factor ENY2 n=1 Tax=Tropilaelaps mercedesae TaxID=418985 RepID=A0A1V9Y077_9ACAR|nr:enhancer of yellow 2 transcription factor-like [Tropilaelaps mercedesae]
MNAELSERVKARLVQSGEEERIRELLKTRLVSCGWKDELKAEARKFIKERGVNNVNVDEVHTHLMPKARSIIPDSVKKELLYEIREFIMRNGGIF